MSKDLVERKYTEKQERFLNLLFDEKCLGDIRAAMTLAGYSKESNVHDLTNSLKDEIIERTNLFIATAAPQAAMQVISVMNKPEALGSSIRLNAAKEVLDQVGLVKKEHKEVHVKVENIVELPAKNEPITIEGELVK